MSKRDTFPRNTKHHLLPFNLSALSLELAIVYLRSFSSSELFQPTFFLISAACLRSCIFSLSRELFFDATSEPKKSWTHESVFREASNSPCEASLFFPNFLYFLTHTLSQHPHKHHYNKKKMLSLTSTVASPKLTSKVRTVEPVLRSRSRFASASSATLSEIFFCFLISPA